MRLLPRRARRGARGPGRCLVLVSVSEMVVMMVLSFFFPFVFRPTSINHPSISFFLHYFTPLLRTVYRSNYSPVGPDRALLHSWIVSGTRARRR